MSNLNCRLCGLDAFSSPHNATAIMVLTTRGTFSWAVCSDCWKAIRIAMRPHEGDEIEENLEFYESRLPRLEQPAS